MRTQRPGQLRLYGFLTVGLILALLVLAACGTSSLKKPWEEPFNEEGSWQLSSDAAAEVAIAEGQLQIHILQPGQIAWATTGRTFSDFHLRVEATQLAGPVDNEYGILVRLEDDTHFYAFSISGDGYARVAHYAAGVWTVLGSDWTPQAAVHQGAATNVLEVEARGTQFTFWVNGEQVAQITDETLPDGDVGLYAGAFDEAGVQIAFDNLLMSSVVK